MRSKRSIGWVALVAAGLVLVTGCGKESVAKGSSALVSSPTIEKGNSPYCQALADWIAYDHFKVGGEGEPGAVGMPLANKPGAASANKAYREKYLRFASEALRLAPPEIKSAWTAYYGAVSGPLAAIDKKYDYVFTNPKYVDETEVHPSAALMKGFMAFDPINNYEVAVCGNGGPEPAKVTYTGSRSSAYCHERKRENDTFGAIIVAGTKPDALKAFVTSDAFASDAQAHRAPAPIRADAMASAKWAKEKWVPLLAKYGYDVPKLVVQGSSVERHALDRSTPDIARVISRTDAYEAQVCKI